MRLHHLTKAAVEREEVFLVAHPRTVWRIDHDNARRPVRRAHFGGTMAGELSGLGNFSTRGIGGGHLHRTLIAVRAEKPQALTVVLRRAALRVKGPRIKACQILKGKAA